MQFPDMPRLTIVTTLVAALAAPLHAQDTRTTIVLDGSGSMWGQIDGEAKITIAQRALTGLIDELDGSTQLGLVAYGHRERGQCNDIETMVAPGPDTQSAVLDALGSISPKGKTPLSDAVLFAAEGLRHTEERATVILISDGIETCNADPCEVGRRLEETGIDFTAHVIGFDVDDEAAAQLSCLAKATGGQFITASDATGLADALDQVAVAPAPMPVTVTFRAEVEGTGAPIDDGLIWTVTPQDAAAPLIENEYAATATLDLMPGDFEAFVMSTETEATATADVSVTHGAAPFTVVLTLPEPTPQASLDLPQTAVAGSTIPIGWTGPEDDGDYLAVHETNASDGSYVNYVYVREGSPASLLMPITPGTYDVRYISAGPRQALATAMIEVTPVAATLSAPEIAPVGAAVSVAWTGPDYDGDYITVAAPDVPGGQYVNYTYTREGGTLDLIMPGEPGAYEVRYIAAQDGTVIARKPITVTDQAATLDAPETADVGSTLSVGWTGPAYDGDYITVAREDQAPGAYENYVYPGDGDRADLTMPEVPGFYELRYVLGESKRVLVAQPITVLAVSASVQGPQTAMAGGVADLRWSGPAYDGDYLSVAKPDAQPKTYEHWGRIDTDVVALTMPDTPGDYELRYVLPEGDGNVLAAQPITILPAEATLIAPNSVVRGGTITLDWTGPNGPRDYLSLAVPDAADTKYEDYIYTRAGNTVEIPAPREPGLYELRYVMAGAHRVIARLPIEVTLPAARLAAPTQASPGAVLQIAWQGPGAGGDAIAVVPRGGGAEAALSSGMVASGNPVALTLPETAGAYDLVYVKDGEVVFRQEMTLQ